MILRVSPTMLESYRLYRAAEFISTEEMEARIRREYAEPSEAQRIGTAFHACLEGVAELLGDGVEVPMYLYDGLLFDSVTVDGARKGLDGALPEVPGEAHLTVDGYVVRLGGRADYVRGSHLWDIKSSLKPIAPERPADSMQWRCYHLIYGATRITYRHCQLAESEGIYSVRDWHDVTLYPYPGIHRDVEAALRGLLEFARGRGILETLEAA